jgi:DNA-binding CsgD family transcriptional regulator
MPGAAAIGREDELDAIRAFLGRVEDGPAALVLSGEAGIGKTILWEKGVEEAQQRVGCVLTCRGVEAVESQLLEQPEPPWRFERARTLLCLGIVRRQAQQKRPARQALEEALAIFAELGARLWAEKARGELRRISGRRPAEVELTETERRVAELAARDRTNKEIAAELFMGVSTVEAHLSHVYRKLGVRRAELARSLEKAAAP